MSPMPNTLIVLGYALGGVFRGVFTGVLVTCVAIFFTRVHFAHWLLMIYTMLITAFLFALVGIINGVFARNFDDVSWIPSFVIAPLTYLGGVFYSISMLPPVWRFISHFDPIYYLIASFRFSVLGLKNDVTGYALLVSTLLVIVSFFVTVYFLTYSSRMRD